ncbi:hypothetical protein CAT7_02764 [Carnobacterium sp. AT7]|uniref:hypothetical protein n=1 Tax=Carnobacterium TaxID=2747 RepID=UPI00015F0919|nr:MULTISPECIES: hypothetical protein [Carnobacterium]EDP68368.1 hypothetical protein CAT7_02764 [Carnobacterium sp. AT7]
MDSKTLNALSKEDLIELVIRQSEELKEQDIQLEAELEENRFIKSLGFVDGYKNYRNYFIRFFEDESDGTAKKGSIFLGIMEDFINDYGSEPVRELMDEFIEDHV